MVGAKGGVGVRVEVAERGLQLGWGGYSRVDHLVSHGDGDGVVERVRWCHTEDD